MCHVFDIVLWNWVLSDEEDCVCPFYSPSHSLRQSAEFICYGLRSDFLVFGIPDLLVVVEIITCFFVMHKLELFALLLELEAHLVVLWDSCLVDCGVMNEVT
jgi:hypothetical protein